MTLSAVFLAAAGISLIFLPDEILNYIGISPSKNFQLILQISGSLYFAFAMLNWMSKGSLIGGIYNRPAAIGNFTHFFIVGIFLIKEVINNPGLHFIIWILTIVYLIFALLFGLILFSHPADKV